jgi:outer membrane lipoprotein-sorting protein
VDYSHKLIGEEKVRDQDCYKLELTPLPDAAVVWGKVIFWVTKNGFDQWMVEYYDEDNKLVSTSNSFDLEQMGDRIIPTRIEITPKNKKGQKTVLHIDQMKFNIKLDESFFSQQNMKKIK